MGGPSRAIFTDFANPSSDVWEQLLRKFIEQLFLNARAGTDQNGTGFWFLVGGIKAKISYGRVP